MPLADITLYLDFYLSRYYATVSIWTAPDARAADPSQRSFGCTFALGVASQAAPRWAMAALIERPGNGLVKWGGVCTFYGPPVKFSLYMLGGKARLEVVVDNEADVLEVDFTARGANRDVYKGFLKGRKAMGEFVMKAGTTLDCANSSLP